MVRLRGLNHKLSKLKLTKKQKNWLQVQDWTAYTKNDPSRTLGRFARYVNKKVKRGWKNPHHFKY